MSPNTQLPHLRTYPENAWYVLATSDEVGSTPLGRRAADLGIVLYRTSDGTAIALEDRCAHRPYPLSLGAVDGDTIVSGYTGFAYGPDGVCVRVPTQTQVPYGARVRAFPVHEDGTFVWVWTGQPAIAKLRPPARTPWLDHAEWASFGEAWDTAANVLLLHENFADITHVAVVDPFIAPPVLSGPPPPLEIEVSENRVSFSRVYAAAPLAGWHAAALKQAADAQHEQREEGSFVSPGLWVDEWEVRSKDGPSAIFRFTHAVTPIDSGHTRHVWRVSRNFALDDATTATLSPIFAAYYRRVQGILETMQSIIDRDGPRAEVRVTADLAAVQVGKIMRQLVADESGSRVRRIRPVQVPTSGSGRR